MVRYYYETSSIERTKSDTGSVRTERILLASGSQGENGDQAAWENTVQILGEKLLPQLTLTTTCGLDITALEQLTNRQ